MIADFIKRQRQVAFRNLSNDSKDIELAKKKIEEFSLKPHDIPKTISDEDASKKRCGFKCPICGAERGITFDIDAVAEGVAKEIVESISMDYKISSRDWLIRFKCLDCGTGWSDTYRVGCIGREVTFVTTKPAEHIEVDVKAHSVEDKIVADYSGAFGVKEEYYKRIRFDSEHDYTLAVDELIHDEAKSIAGEDDVEHKEKR